MGTITLSEKQQRRAEILSRLASGALSTAEAAEYLGRTERQVRRLRERYRSLGLSSVVHGNQGRTPQNKTDPGAVSRIETLAGKEGPYHGFNTCHLQELLEEREDIRIGRSTLDRILVEAGARKRSRSRPRRVYLRRERRSRAGELLLIDGSPHAWLERRGPKMSLMAAIDDATSDVVHLRFWPTECLAGYLHLVEQVVTTFGVPESFYHDKHTILVSPKEPTREEELAGKEPRSQFQETLTRLGIEGIKAHSPQAKGRIERLFRTLQDRLLNEMRLAHITTIEEANAFLPAFLQRFNIRFHREPKEPDPAWVVPTEPLDLPYYFAAIQTRHVKVDHTLSWQGRTLQIQRKRGEPSLAGTRVAVHIDTRGECHLYRDKERLTYTELKNRPAPPPPTQAQKKSRTPEEVRAARRRKMAAMHAQKVA